jgi:hypothetical protein
LGSPHEIESKASRGRYAQTHHPPLRLGGDRRLLLIPRSKPRDHTRDRSADIVGEGTFMSKAYIIEIHDRTAGIVAGDERGFTFFSSERAFDRLDGRDFRSAREAERAARAVLGGRRTSTHSQS